jgi:hypothetical protein
MKTALALRLLVVSGAWLSAQAYAADVKATVAEGKEVGRSASAVIAKPVNTGKVATQTGAVVGKNGDNQYPTGAPVVPPKPKKDGPEAGAAAAAALKAKTNAAP